MEDNRVDVTRQRTIILIVGFICFAFVIVALSFIIGYFTSDDPKVAISNEKTVQKSEDTSINGHDYSMIKKQENVFNHYKFELNNLNKRIDLIENNCNKKLKDVSDKIEEITKIINNLKIFNNDLTNKITRQQRTQNILRHSALAQKAIPRLIQT